MNLQEFYKTVEDIILYPGTVSELNQRKDIIENGKKYEETPLVGGKKFITGIIIPSPLEFQELLKATPYVTGALDDMLEDEDKLNMDEEITNLIGEMEPMIMKMWGSPAVMDLDLRLKAKKMGANGLVHVQLYNKDNASMGVPVKEE